MEFVCGEFQHNPQLSKALLSLFIYTSFVSSAIPAISMTDISLLNVIMVATAVSGRLRLTVTTAVTGRLRLTVRSAVSGRPNPEVNKRHSNPDFEPIRHFRDLSAETMTSSMFRLWFMKLLFASGRIFHEKTKFYAQHDVASWPVGPPLRSTEFGSVWGHFRVCEAEFRGTNASDERWRGQPALSAG